MAYKIIKREFVRLRPRWLVRLLWEIPAQVYEVCDTESDVHSRFQVINDKIAEARLFERNKKLYLKPVKDGISINSIYKDRVFITFTINNSYCKI